MAFDAGIKGFAARNDPRRGIDRASIIRMNIARSGFSAERERVQSAVRL
jgi:hypothetical protein